MCDSPRQRAERQARQTEPIDASVFAEMHIAHEVQQIEILVALSLRTAQAGFREAQRLEQHSFLNYDELTADQRHKTAPYPRTLEVNRNVYHHLVRYPYDMTTLEEAITQGVCALLIAIRDVLGGHQQVVWSTPLAVTERYRQGHFRCNIWLILHVKPLELNVHI